MGRTGKEERRKEHRRGDEPDAPPRRPQRYQHTGGDALSVFRDISGTAPTGLQEMTLVFGEREIGGRKQVVSVKEDDGTIIFPLTERWTPSRARMIACYVIIPKQERKDGTRIGFAMPRETRDAMRYGELRPPTNAIKEVVFRRGRDGEVFGFAANGKRVIVPPGSGVKITDEELEVTEYDREANARKVVKEGVLVPVMVSEKMSAFVVGARVKPELIAALTGGAVGATDALVRRADAAGTLLAADQYWVVVDGEYRDAVAELGVEKDTPLQEIADAYKQLARELHPDTRLAAARKLLQGREPSKARKDEINHEFRVVKAAFECLKLLRKREEASRRYQQAGANALPLAALAQLGQGENMEGIEVLGHVRSDAEELGFNGNAEELVVEGLRAIGYPDLTADVQLSREAALTLAGWLVKHKRAAKAQEGAAVADSSGTKATAASS